MLRSPLSSWLLVLLALIGLLSVPACTETEDAGVRVGDEPFEYVPAGKADDYRSTQGREFSLVAVDVVTLEGADLDLSGDERMVRAEELVELRFKAVSFFLYAYLAGKSSHDDNAEYGGFRTTVRQQTFDTLEIEERVGETGVFDFYFEAEVAGPNDLLSLLPLYDNMFELTIPTLTNAELESGSYSRTYSHFNPADHDPAILEGLEMEIDEKPSEPDAYPDYSALFADGLLDVTIQVGGDYNDERYDLIAARDIFTRLKTDLGLNSPVATFEELKTTSGPFTGSFDSDGEEITVEVTLYHPDMQLEEGVGFTGLIELYKAAAAKSDVVLYDGHAGYDSTYSGVVVHYNPRYAVAADDFDELELPDKYQLFFFNGCKTYTSYADAMYQHPTKSAANLDIITTVNFSWLSEMTRISTDFLGAIMYVPAETHVPRSYDALLSELNQGRSWDVIYGIHGLSDNPRSSPYAVPDSLCSSCSSNSECPGIDNLCIVGATSPACAMACTDDTGCPEGYFCSAAAASGSMLISASQCIPTGGLCQ